MLYKRMPIEKESPEETGYDSIKYNLAESSVTDLTLEELDIPLSNLKLEYIIHRGHVGFRRLIAAEAGNLYENAVLLTNGAAGALFIINSALLTANDHLIVVRPNYATNIEVPRTIGCKISYIDLKFDNNWRIDVNSIEAAIIPQTKLISLTSPHNPTGMEMNENELNAIIAIAEKYNIHILFDETYRDACFKTTHSIMASRSKKIISVSSLSKAFGLPGLRMGWLITQDEDLMEQFLAAKEMIYISNSALDEAVAYQFYLKRDVFLNKINAKAQQNLEFLKEWLRTESHFEAVLPQGGVVCFARIKQPEYVDIARFYTVLMEKYQTMVGPGHWFEMPDNYMRIGFGWTDGDTLKTGLENISKTIRECIL